MKKNNVRKVFSIVLIVSMLMTICNIVIFAETNRLWNSGAKINYVPTSYDREYNVSSWLYNSCPELDLTSYEDLTVPASRWNVFAGVLRTYQNYLKTTDQTLLTSNGYTLDQFEDSGSLEPYVAQGEAKIMVRLGLLEGRLTEDGLLYMDMADDITRAETAKILSVFYDKLKSNVSVTRGLSDFDDIRGHWAEQYIEYCYQRELLNGKSANFFDPDGLVTKEEVIQILINMIEKYDINGISARNVAKALNETFYVTTSYDEENNSSSSSSTSSNYRTPITSDNYYYTVRPNSTVTVKVRCSSSRRLNITSVNSNIKVTSSTSSSGVYTVQVKGISEGNGFLKCEYTSGASDYETLFIPVFVREYSTNKATSINLNESSISLSVGESYMLSNLVSISPSNAVYNGIYYASSNPSVASVNYLSGQITANGSGTAYIYIVTYGASRRITVNVSGYSYYPGDNNYYTDFRLSNNIGTVYVGNTLDLKRYIYNNTGYKITYKSMDTTRATVSTNGIVTGKRSGFTQILITCNGRQLIFYLTVSSNSYYPDYDYDITSITLNKTYVNISVGGTFDLDEWIDIYPYNADRSDLRYRSLDTSVAEVGTRNGIITGVSYGTTQIKVYSGNVERYVTVQVGYSGTDDNEIPVTNINLKNTNISLNVGDVYYLSNDVTVLPNNATNNTAYYTSSNYSIVNVGTVSGRMDAYAPGTVTITVEAGNIKRYVTVTVSQNGTSPTPIPSDPPTPTFTPEPSTDTLEFLVTDTINLKVGMEFNPYSVLAGTYNNVTFSFSIDGIARMENGRVVGVTPGDTILIAKDEKGNTATLPFHIY